MNGMAQVAIPEAVVAHHSRTNPVLRSSWGRGPVAFGVVGEGTSRLSSLCV
jgi:hypothetical protein